MSRILLNDGSFDGVKQWGEYDNLTGDYHFISEGDATPVLEFNRAQANDTELTKYGIKNGFWKYASMPSIFLVTIKTKYGLDWWKREHAAAISKILEHPDYRYLKCTNKRHIIKAHD